MGGATDRQGPVPAMRGQIVIKPVPELHGAAAYAIMFIPVRLVRPVRSKAVKVPASLTEADMNAPEIRIAITARTKIHVWPLTKLAPMEPFRNKLAMTA